MYGAPGGITESTEEPPSIAASLLSGATRLTVRTALAVGSRAAHLPWPWGAVDFAARAIPSPPGVIRTLVELPTAKAQLVRAPGVAARAGRVVLYLHGGGFFCCGLNTHTNIVTRLSRYAQAPVLAVNYRLLPRHSIDQALDDCHDAYSWLLGKGGYRRDQIVVAGDSAGGYLALTLAQQLLPAGAAPAGLALISPLLQLDPRPKQAHPNSRKDAMLPPEAFDALAALASASAARSRRARKHYPPDLYEPLEHITPGLPPTLLHVSGDEVLLHDSRVAAQELAAAGVSVELRVWPGQTHVFQMAAPLVPEAVRSLRQIGAYIRNVAAPVPMAAIN